MSEAPNARKPAAEDNMPPSPVGADLRGSKESLFLYLVQALAPVYANAMIAKGEDAGHVLDRLSRTLTDALFVSRFINSDTPASTAASQFVQQYFDHGGLTDWYRDVFLPTNLQQGQGVDWPLTEF